MGAGKPGVQNLVGDIGRFEEDDDVGKFLVQPLAQTFGGDLGGGVVRGQRDENVAVVVADHRAVAERQIEPAGRHADVVENGVQLAGRNHAADFLFNFGEDQLGLLDARSGRRLRVQTNLSGIHGGEEIAAHQVNQTQGAQRENQEHRRARRRDDRAPSPAVPV